MWQPHPNTLMYELAGTYCMALLSGMVYVLFTAVSMINIREDRALAINSIAWCVLFFFFQAEDGIRDLTVTGVQTCALPICDGRFRQVRQEAGDAVTGHHPGAAQSIGHARHLRPQLPVRECAARAALVAERSEERRVGKEGRSRWSPYH